MPNPSMDAPPFWFPAYLSLPLKFRRKSSTSSTGSSILAASPPFATSAFDSSPNPTYLAGSTGRLRCARCLADLAMTSQIISKGFTGRHGRAYLVAPSSALTESPHEPMATTKSAGVTEAARRGELPNTMTHRSVPRQLVTGLHTVGDISCASCNITLGWKYIAAEAEAQQYKVGKFILEGKRVVTWGGWDDDDAADDAMNGLNLDERAAKDARATAHFEEDDIEFDSHDEDECEDLFLGIWNPQTAARRRRMKRFGKDDL